MNYYEINDAILGDREIDPIKVEKDRAFYRYLFNNKVAYYYSRYLSGDPTPEEAGIVGRGNELNQRYLVTLTFLKHICDRHSIDFLIYKTHKFIPEVVDGDIDLVIHENDFYPLLRLLRESGFDCVEDEPGKAKCVKDGYATVEPHITVSWHGRGCISPDQVWAHSVEQTVPFLFKTTSPEFDSWVRMLQILYVPQYLTLYDIKHLKKYPVRSPLILENDLERLLVRVVGHVPVRKSPVFMPFLVYTKNCLGELIHFRYPSIVVGNLVRFIYWVLRYKLFNRLPFGHEW